MAVRLVVLFLEGSFVKLFQAEGTDKVFWVEFLAHSSNTATCDRLLTAGAERPTSFMIMHLTIGLPIMFEKTAIDEGCKALPAHKALWVPQCV